MPASHSTGVLNSLAAWLFDRLTERGERHGIGLSMFIEAAPLDTAALWPKLYAALDLIARHSPAWLGRMRKMGNSVHVRRIPGTRAMLTENRFTILDPYLLADFLPAQIAASIIHEATHARLRTSGLPLSEYGLAREERACRRSELRFGRRLLASGVEGAEPVIERAAGALAGADDEVGVAVNWEEWRANGAVARINDLRAPRWLKRLVAKRAGVLDSPQGRAAFGDRA